MPATDAGLASRRPDDAAGGVPHWRLTLTAALLLLTTACASAAPRPADSQAVQTPAAGAAEAGPPTEPPATSAAEPGAAQDTIPSGALNGAALPPAPAVPVGAAAAPASEALPAASDASGLSPCDGPPAPPLGSGPDFWRAFREPLPRAPLWNPPGPWRVGLQAGHWQVEQAPEELSRLQHGAVGGGKQEWEVNLDIAQRTKALLEAAGAQVDLLPATVPPRYRAHVFLAIHADGDPAGRARGFKIARPGFSSIPDVDDQLVAALYAAYGAATGLPRDDLNITLRMRYYYAFNSRRYCHAVAPGVPQAIIETGFLTSALDRQLLLGEPDAVARGIASGLLAFLESLPRP